jgi:segregation and condensation protein A
MNLSNFSGPMDLLYNMVKEKQMNIMELNVVELTNEYMAYIKSQQSLDIEVASEYLTMAATLLELKSKSLLPVDETTVIEDDQYSYDIFLEQLSRYDQIRKVSNFLS